MQRDVIPTVLVTGTVGSGKTSVADEIAVLLNEQDLRFALLDLDWLCQAYPPPPDDLHRTGLMFKNLGAVWPNFRERGIDYLILAHVLEQRQDLDRYTEAIPEADITVVRVVAPPELIAARLKRREVGSMHEHMMKLTAEVTALLDAAGVEDFSVTNDDRPVSVVAKEVMTRLGWSVP